MKIKIAAITDTGKERTNNEDAFIICPDLSQQDWAHNNTHSYILSGKYGSLLVVADGMGGACAGEVASAIATKTIRSSFSKINIEKFLNSNDIDGLILYSIKNADEAINKKIWDDPDTSGMGTTIVVCWIIDNVAHIGWCGDSRCYVYNPLSGIKQLTKDHSYVQELVDKGEISEKEALTHPDNNVITRGLGDMDSQSTPEITSYSLSINDIILLCSDGLCGYCTNRAIERVLEKSGIDLMKCRDELMKLALDAGGYDNICIALASIIGDDQSLPVPLTTTQKVWLYVKRILKKYSR